MEVGELEDPGHRDGASGKGGRLVWRAGVEVRDVEGPVCLSGGPAGAGGAEDHPTDVSTGESSLNKFLDVSYSSTCLSRTSHV